MDNTTPRGSRKLFAIASALPVVAQFVGKLQEHMDTPAIRYEPTGQGEARARARLAAQRKANAAQAKAEPEAPMTRQQRRAKERRIAKLKRF